jgi:hypothetical protein
MAAGTRAAGDGGAGQGQAGEDGATAWDMARALVVKPAAAERSSGATSAIV